ncbi:DNA-processing protein DprA [uncultured Phocaeicola sp.]|jgi:DNA processing protein|uniref:DNA-processing protein DprA n=1 Tax=uncultured Phocaeicola sp. TaxID=990718 RepID=UPI0025D51F55|nr:DNA-processing protein DprA [uncultured Phocaeicola sp.]
MKSEETLYTLALTHIPGLGLIGAHHLLHATGNATILFTQTNSLPDLLPGITPRILEALKTHGDEALRWAETELAFVEKNQITCLCLQDESYPSRLRECDDAPIVLFYRGTANLNSMHIINLVGTRNATEYGKEICRNFIHDLKQLLPDILIVSGLAYGIDIQAHRSALEYGFDTVGVLAHGIDRIYPATHRQTAVQMLQQGGLLTEFPTGTNPDKQNFVKRNRIIAGISDATIVVESAEKGGALITADIAESYHRDCFAFPGRIDAPYSAGCNQLIQNNRAALLQNATDLVKAMNWDLQATAPEAIQRQLFPDLSEEESNICQLLGKHPKGLQINTLVVESNIPINRITSILFELEMKGMIRTLAGGMYRLL